MSYWKCAIALMLGLSLRAYAVESVPEYAYRIPANQVSGDRIFISVNDKTGAVKFWSTSGTWENGEHVNLKVASSDLVKRAGWDGPDAGWGEDCDCEVAQPPPPAYYYGNGYLYGGAYPRAPYYRPSKVYRRVERHDYVYEYKRVSRPPVPTPPYYYPAQLPPPGYAPGYYQPPY